MKRVFICSPLRSKLRDGVEKNQERARFYCKFAMAAGHRPFAPHLFYTQLLDDNVPDERELGIALGLADLLQCDEVWAFGFPTAGMDAEVRFAEHNAIPVRRFTAECMPISQTN